MNYNNQPLIYVATQAQYNSLNLSNDQKNASAAFIGDPRKITTHGVDYFCGTSDIESRIGDINTNITNILSRLNNIAPDTPNSESLAGRVATLEALMGLINPEDNDPQNNIADFLDLLNSLKNTVDQTQTTIITTINNNLSNIDFWYTYGEE